jgi:hypothetical protein
MLTGHQSRVLVYLAATGLLSGCAQPGPLASRHTTIGALKTSLSHLEFENEQLKAKVANIDSENREIENRLVEEEALNGDLRARLDNARNLLSDRGYNWDARTSAGGSPTERDQFSSGESSSRTLPAGRSDRKPRKPPFARIPSRREAPATDADASLDAELPPSRIPRADAFGPQSWREDDAQWLPIARGGNDPAAKVR